MSARARSSGRSEIVSGAVDLDELRAAGRAGLDRHGRLTAPKFLRNELDQLVVRFARDRRRLKACEPYAAGRTFERAHARARAARTSMMTIVRLDPLQP